MVTAKHAHAAAAALAAALLLLSVKVASADEPDPATRPTDDVEVEAPAPSDRRAPVPEAKPVAADALPAAPAPPDQAPKLAESPAIHHAPIASAEAGLALPIQVTVERAHLLKSAHVVFSTKEGLLALPLLRSADEGYTAVIPAEHVKAPGLGYAIEMERIDGTRAAVFGTRDALQPIAVRGDPTDVRERWLLDRLGQRRSVASATVELIRFGTTVGDPAIPCAANQGKLCNAGESVVPRVDDQYWRAEGSYTYRLLRTVSEFTFRAGVVRGRSLVDVPELDDKKFDVGLNYAGASVRFRLASLFHIELELLGNVTEVGFSTGAGAAFHFGDPYGTKFTVGWQTIGFASDTYFGTRFYTRLDLAATGRITIAPNIEVTDMPHAETFGVRLLTDAGFALGRGFSLWVRGGYQARISRSGGPALGTTLQLAF
jgi:hypothetical protein